MSNFDFRFDLSTEGWSDQTCYVFRGPTVDEITHHLLLAVTRKLDDDSLDAYADFQIGIITSNLKDIEVIRKREISLGDLPARELIVKWTMANAQVRYKRYLFSVYGGKGYTFNCDFSRNSYALLSEQMTQIVAGLLNQSRQGSSGNASATP